MSGPLLSAHGTFGCHGCGGLYRQCKGQRCHWCMLSASQNATINPLTVLSRVGVSHSFCIFVVKSLELCGFLQLQSLTFNNLKQFSGPCFFYSLNGVLSLAALGSMNLTMYRCVLTEVARLLLYGE